MEASSRLPTSCTRTPGSQKDPDSKQASSIAHVNAIEAVDPYPVRLRTKNADAALPFRLAQRFITNKAAYDRLGGILARTVYAWDLKPSLR
jgi:ABC-type transport system substrate-binding protein